MVENDLFLFSRLQVWHVPKRGHVCPREISNIIARVRKASLKLCNFFGDLRDNEFIS